MKKMTESASTPPADLVLDELRALRSELASLRALILGAVNVPVNVPSSTHPDAVAMTVRQAAARLGCSPTKVFGLLRDGDLKRGRKHGRQAMVTVESVEKVSRLPGAKPAPIRLARPPPPHAPYDDAKAQADLRVLLDSMGKRRRK